MRCSASFLVLRIRDAIDLNRLADGAVCVRRLDIANPCSRRGLEAAELLTRTGAAQAADHAYQRAIGLEADPTVRRFLQHHRAQLRGRQSELLATGDAGGRVHDR